MVVWVDGRLLIIEILKYKYYLLISIDAEVDDEDDDDDDDDDVDDEEDDED